jgi:peroxiredoxin
MNFESVNIARPSNFILDIEGTIRFMFIGSNQRDFPEDDQIYSVLAGLSKPAEG